MKLVKIFAPILLMIVTFVSLLSCSIKQNTGILGSKTAAKSQADLAIEGAPFAYDAVIDTISYNSCVGQNLTENGIHGFKIGVNKGFSENNNTGALDAGVKLRSNFLTYVGSHVTPNYPSTTITPGQIQYVLQKSPKNVDSFIQFAVRRRSDLSVLVDVIAASSSSTVTEPRDGRAETVALKSDDVVSQITKGVVFTPAGAVLKEGPFIYNLYDKKAPLPIEAALSYNRSVDETFPANSAFDDGTGYGEQYADNVRKKFNSASSDKVILAVTYGNPFSSTGSAADKGLSSPKREDAADKTHAYGRAYALQFQTTSAKAGWLANQLRSVSETALAKNDAADSPGWTCSSYYIMKQEEWNVQKADQAGCAPLTSNDMEAPGVRDQLANLRRHYSEKNWNIGLYFGKAQPYLPTARNPRALCLVPKPGNAECYLPTSGITSVPETDVHVQYNPQEECYLSRYQEMGVSYAAGMGDNARNLGRCPQFASICTRN